MLHDRELTLFDGTRLVRQDRYDQMRRTFDDTELRSRKVLPVHPAFHILCTACIPTIKDAWLTPEVMALFHFHVLPDMTVPQMTALLRQLFPAIPANLLSKLLDFNGRVHQLQMKGSEAMNEGQDLHLSLRQLIRICRHVSSYPNDL